MKFVVTGSRHMNNDEMFNRVMDEIFKARPISEIAQGGATGADELARKWAVANKLKVKTYFAAWKTYGASADPRRNSLMLTEFKPEFVVAFPGGDGTADCVKKARRAKIPIIEVTSEGLWKIPEVHPPVRKGL